MKCVIKDMIGENCITLEDGQSVYDLIHPELKAGHPVEVDFQGATVFASPFFNAGFGQLLRDISGDDLNRLLKVSNMIAAGFNVLRRVIENSRQYYSDPKNAAAVDQAMANKAEGKGCH